MTRAEIEADYAVVSGVIVSPGKFEGEPVYAPHFFDASLNGGPDDYADDGGVDVMLFAIQPEDLAEFPELEGSDNIRMWENDSGFIYTKLS